MYVQKYRPFRYQGIVGQPAVTKDLINRSKDLNFPGTMIFTGPTGSGKTTAALITAAILNDPNPIEESDGSKSPNLESKSSSAIRNESFNRDVTFHDASTMGKDDVVALEDVVRSAPLFDTNKVVIIDEAQELTKASKGVALRLLEKKRKNVHLILCTMEPERFGKAVLDRGQQFRFNKVDPITMAEHLFSIIKDEDIDVPDEFLEKGIFDICDYADGSVRAAVQNLERCVSAGLFNASEIEQELGILGNEKLGAVLIDLVNNATPKSFLTMKGESLKEFYYKSFRVLLDALQYYHIGELTPKWKESLASKLIKNVDRVEQLVGIWDDVSQRPYWYDTAFEAKVMRYIAKQSKIKQRPLREPV